MVDTPTMTAGKAAFPRTQNGYSPKHVDEFIAALVQRARAQVATLESRIAEIEAAQRMSIEPDASGRLEELERLVAERDAQVAEERARILFLQSRPAPAGPEPEVAVEDRGSIDDPQDWATSVIGRSLYDSWTEEQRERAAVALRSKRLSACTPTE